MFDLTTTKNFEIRTDLKSQFTSIILQYAEPESIQEELKKGPKIMYNFVYSTTK